MAILDKDPAILAAIDGLLSQLGLDEFVLADHWEQDLCAVGVASPRDPSVLAYISCYGEPPGRFSDELEMSVPPGDGIPYRVVATGSDITLKESAVVGAGHLRTI